MRIRAETRPTIRTINLHLVRFERTGLYTTRECIIERGKFNGYLARRPKKAGYVRRTAEGCNPRGEQ